MLILDDERDQLDRERTGHPWQITTSSNWSSPSRWTRRTSPSRASTRTCPASKPPPPSRRVRASSGIDGMTASMVKGATAGNLLADAIKGALEWAKEWTIGAAMAAAHDERLVAITRIAGQGARRRRRRRSRRRSRPSGRWGTQRTTPRPACRSSSSRISVWTRPPASPRSPRTPPPSTPKAWTPPKRSRSSCWRSRRGRVAASGR